MCSPTTTPTYSTIYLVESLLTFVLIEYKQQPTNRSLSKEDLLWQVKIAQDGMGFLKNMALDWKKEGSNFDHSLRILCVMDFSDGDVKKWLRGCFDEMPVPADWKPLF